RRPPARLPLRLARHDAVAVLLEQARVGFVPTGPFPAGGLVEDRSELLLPAVEGAEPHPAVRQPLLHRMDDPVRPVVALVGARIDVALRSLVVVEARDVG